MKKLPSMQRVTLIQGIKRVKPNSKTLGPVAQSVTCLTTDASLTADPGVARSILARSHTFVEIDHEIISTVIELVTPGSAVSHVTDCPTWPCVWFEVLHPSQQLWSC